MASEKRRAKPRKPASLRSDGLLVASIEGTRSGPYINVHFWFCNEHGARRLANWLGKAGAWLATQELQ